MRKIVLTGIRFGKLVVLNQGPHFGPLIGWYCLCDCGQLTHVRAGHLTSKRIRSCGCLVGEKHGEAYNKSNEGRWVSKEYKAWSHAKARCLNKNNKKYPIYGGRGITMCQEWQRSYKAFLRHMGRSPAGRSLDRIDVNGHYEPGNCRWATASEQSRNRRPWMRGPNHEIRNAVTWLQNHPVSLLLLLLAWRPSPERSIGAFLLRAPSGWHLSAQIPK